MKVEKNGTSSGAEEDGEVAYRCSARSDKFREKDAILTQMLRLIEAFSKISGQDAARRVRSIWTTV
ncbi:hypothetical protein ABIF65_005545 [Bradyrhizobium japonicum]|uniref:hypothetical protein n=1 Tax=Bradyrhizobium TaxID=374 RepID=UPI0012BD7390|nr:MULTISPECIES: hypothetical protein [Bradyrhizobium]MBR0883846.1 hypothetical protein [Bradyrhizobium liaoningense]MBR0947352.1 hypothetical protein [Bradyrhizobium liaoningense]MBR1003921.1 hypothetical protein [Bradyrhizobium liaoningense]MBR1032883.1 hypothetical protein [Bradyrhizobium liaoningense]MBR1070227.1 hypothetical protein [Bradyrhizobium liaoningense]